MWLRSIFIFVFLSEINAQYGQPQPGSYQRSMAPQQRAPQGIRTDGSAENATLVGKEGCVVTGRILFINGIKDHELSADEMEELQAYNAALQKYKDQVKQIEEFRSQVGRYQNSPQNGMYMYGQGQPQQGYSNQGFQRQPQGYPQQQGYNQNYNYRQGRQADPGAQNPDATTAKTAGGMGSEVLADPDNPQTSTLMPNLTMPELPAKPSFCGDNATTQYVFDSCMVQGGKVYIGGAYARDLSADELTSLDDYKTKLDEYKNQTQGYQQGYQPQSYQQGQYGMNQGYPSQNQNYRVPRQYPPQQGQYQRQNAPVRGPNGQSQQTEAPTPPDFCQMLQ